jgi:hypothetical protein
MVRNSYKFGDSINAYKWDRKATYLSYFNKFAEAFHVRETLVKEGYLGVTSAAIQGTYDKNGTATKISRLWDDLVDVRSDHSRRAILAAQTEFSQLSGSSLHDFYSFLGGRMSGASDTIGIGDGTLAVAFDSSQLDVDTYANLSVSGTAMPIGKYQCLITMRLA